MNAVLNKTASGVIRAGPGIMFSALLTGGSDAATLILYDNATTNSGTIICKLAAATGVSVSWNPPKGVTATLGIYAALTGTSPSASVAYG